MMSWLYAVTIYPLELIYRYLYITGVNLTGSYGVGLLFLSLCGFLAFIPLKRMVASAQKQERELQDVLKPQIERISKECAGTERHERVSRLYKRYAYHPVMAIRSTFGVFLQLPFLLAAYHMIGGLDALRGEPFFFLSDLSKPDGLLNGINLLPIAMTLVNFATTFTSPDMRFKERAQAMLIALLFLALLYNSPSALLLFWTCNNVLFLGENLWGKVWKKFSSFGHSRLFRSIRHSVFSFSTEVLLAISLAATLFVFVPIDLYMSNASELWFPLHSIMGGIIVAFLVFAFLLFVFLRILGSKIRSLMVSLLLALTLGFFLQSNFLNVYYGVLDGTPIPWEKYGTVAIVNTSIWCALLITPFLLRRLLRPALYSKIITHTAALLVGIQTLFMVFTLGASLLPAKGNYYLSTEKMFELSSKNNIIVFVLDNFDTELFQKLLKEYPEIADPLDGFTYFPDAVGSYPTTKGALPQMLTGIWYENKEPYTEYIQKAWRGNLFWDWLKERNYDARIFTLPSFVCRDSRVVDNLVHAELQISSIFDLIKDFLRLSAFRFMPHVGKRIFLTYINNFDVYAKSADETIVNYYFNDVVFYKRFTDNAMSIVNTYNSFRFYHLMGVHPPYTVNRHVERTPIGGSSKEEQALGSLKIVRDFILLLKKYNVYDNSSILITTDHGDFSSFLSRPLILLKPQNARVLLSKSPNPVSFSQLHATLLSSIGHECKGLGSSFFESKSMIPRRFLYYQWDNSWDREFLPRMQEYLVKGDAAQFRSWLLTGIYFDQHEGKGFQEPYEYHVGSNILFGGKGASNFITFGWSIEEKTHRWTEGSSAGLRLKIKNNDRDLLFRLKAAAYLGNILPCQTIRVFANDQQIALWKMSSLGWYEAQIPLEIYQKEKILEVVFSISDPTVTASGRKLGIAAYELVVEPYTPRNLYALGESVSFSAKGTNSVFLADGWSKQEERHRWTEGSQAALSFRLRGVDLKKDILLRLNASAYLGGGLPHQEIAVFANGKQVGIWHMTGEGRWYEAVIRSELLDITGKLDISFTIGTPTAPSDVGESGDPRKLGLAAYELVIEAWE